MKVLFVLIDGIGDYQVLKQQNKTSLMHSHIPTFDKIAKYGLNGLVDPVDVGLACGSDTAHLSIFQYNPFQVYRGRGSFETIGSGIPMTHDDIAFKCNFAYINNKTEIVERRRADREFHFWGLDLIKAIDGMKLSLIKEDDSLVTVKHATEHRVGLKVTNSILTDQITGTDPLKDNLKLLKCRAKNLNDQNSVLTADLVNKLSDKIREKLNNHPLTLDRISKGLHYANVILLRGCGKKIKVQTFQEKQNMTGFMIAPTAIIRGLGNSINLDIIDVEGATGDYHSDYMQKAKAYLNHIKNYQFGFVHIKAVDEASHDKSLPKRIEFLQKADQMTDYILQNLPENEDYLVVVTGDHTTPPSYGDHTAEPVPFSIATLGNIRKQNRKELIDEVEKYSELDCGKGQLGRFPGTQIFPLIKRMQEYIK